MPTYDSTHGYILIGKETTQGTPVACTKDVGLVQNFAPNEVRNYTRIHSISQRNAVQLLAGQYDAKGTLETTLQHGRLLTYLFGTAAHVETTSDWKHTFSEADALSSMTLEDGYNASSDIVKTYSGGMISSATLSFDMSGALTMSADLLFHKPTTSTSASSAVISTLPVHPFSWMSLKTGADGSEVTNTGVMSGSITVVNNLEKLYGIGSVLPEEIMPGLRTYEFEFRMKFKDKVDYELFLGGTTPTATGGGSIPSLIFNSNNGIALGSGRREFNIDFSDAVYDAYDKPLKVGEVIYQTFRGMATKITPDNTWFVDSITSALWE